MDGGSSALAMAERSNESEARDTVLPRVELGRARRFRGASHHASSMRLLDLFPGLGGPLAERGSSQARAWLTSPANGGLVHFVCWLCATAGVALAAVAANHTCQNECREGPATRVRGLAREVSAIIATRHSRIAAKP